MLKELQLENFRTFNERVTLRLRPITILIGKNNAGKSSIINFLLMLQQSVDASSPEFLVPDGARVRLGSFRDSRNSVRKRGQLRFRLMFETSAGPLPRERQYIDAILSAKPIIDPVTLQREFRFVAELEKGQTVVRTETMTYEVEGRVGYGPHRMGSCTFSAAIDDEVLVTGEEKNLRTGRFLRFPEKERTPEVMIKDFFGDKYVAPIRDEIADMRHLSAVREESKRAILVSSPPEDYVGQNGEYAIPHLQRIIDDGGGDAIFVMRHITAVAGIKSITFSSPLSSILASCRAVNADTGAEALLSEFGFGVSQCIPVFVQGAITPPHHLLIVEQPEAQLHPTAQIEMGTFFAELWRERKVMSLIETHSANIILRLRRLIAGGQLNPDHVTIGYVHIRKGMPKILNLNIDEKGNLEKGLPMEFFGADLKEALDLGAGR